jgi:hypothetical protein
VEELKRAVQINIRSDKNIACEVAAMHFEKFKKKRVKMQELVK